MDDICLSMARDFHAEIVDEQIAKNATFPKLVTEAEERRKFARRLAKLREKKALSQTVVAACMGTSASVVSKLAAGGYRLYSRKKNPKTGKRRNLGTFPTRAKAEAHERDVQYFKRA